MRFLNFEAIIQLTKTNNTFSRSTINKDNTLEFSVTLHEPQSDIYWD